jgi:hypothetical protein
MAGMKRKKLIPFMHTIHLGDAVLCADCEVISESLNDECSACGSRSLMNIERMLGGCLDPERIRAASINERITRGIFHYVEQA